MSLHVLSAGAAKALVGALAEPFARECGHEVLARFNAVGAIAEAFAAGEACDVLILTRRQIDALAAAGALDPDFLVDLGLVRTGVAVVEGAGTPDVGSEAGLRALLVACSALYLPDPERATAGIHAMKMLRALGLADELAPRLRPYPNGALAMAAMAAAAEHASVGITQVTEIRYSPGVRLAGVLPQAFELATLYSAARATRAREPQAAAQFLHWLGGARSAALRAAGGFE